MNHRRTPLLLALASIIVAGTIGCGSVASPSDGGTGGSAGSIGSAGAGGGPGTGGAGASGNAGAGGGAGAPGVAGRGGTGGADARGGAGGNGGSGGNAGAGGTVWCGNVACATGQTCCSCGVCVPQGTVCTTTVCTDLRWYYTCGDRICSPDGGVRDAGTMSLLPCGADAKLNGPCYTLGATCDPQDNSCNRTFVCATEPSLCPF